MLKLIKLNHNHHHSEVKMLVKSIRRGIRVYLALCVSMLAIILISNTQKAAQQ